MGSCSPHDSSVAKMMGSSSSSDNPLNQVSSGSERAAQREAALMKFRLKRKERCFEKKVFSKQAYALVSCDKVIIFLVCLFVFSVLF